MDPADNLVALCLPISNSFDPNEKQAEPHGNGANGNIPPDIPLTFTIQFQNTGNDTAYNVFILDTLDSHLDEATFAPIGASHSFTTTLRGRILQFSFHGINLVDSITNEPLSHGWVSYTLSPKTGLANGTQLTNRAQIYFDFNPPIATNQTINTIDLLTDVQDQHYFDLLSVRPNPATGSFTVNNKLAGNLLLQLCDITGRTVFSATVAGENPFITVDITALKSGWYFLFVRKDGKLAGMAKVAIAR